MNNIYFFLLLTPFKNSFVITDHVAIYSLWKRRHASIPNDKEVLLEDKR